jgi:L-threonylcarbamoyladenylate synthase
MNADMRIISWEEAAQRLVAGEVGVVPTDTVYGIVGSALKPPTVERIYDLRRRERGKALIVLMADAADLALFGAKVSERTQDLLNRVWPGPVSVVVPVLSPDWAYVHRGLDSIAFRVPNKPRLRDLLKKTGPLVAPSANLAGAEPARTVAEAQAYFGEAVFYVDEGRLNGASSALVDGRTDPPTVLRPAPGFRI